MEYFRVACLKNIFVAILFSIAVLSCSMGKQKLVHQLEDLIEYIRLYHEEFPGADWKEAYARYEQIAADMDNYQYSKEEAEMIGKLEGECVGYFMKSTFKSLDGLESEIKGFFEGMENVVK